MEQIKLNREFPAIEFKLNAEDSYLLIHNVTVTSPLNVKDEWTNFISKVKITAALKYIVFDDAQQRFIDVRKNLFPLHFLVDPYHAQPIFQLNQFIRNETFTLGSNPDLKYYNILKLEIEDPETLDSDHNLEFSIEKFKIDD